MPRLNAKKIRSQVIRDYIQDNHPDKKALCFSCGNAIRWLESVGVENLLKIGPGGDLDPLRWFSPEDIARHWPDHFDATSGHLSIPLMQRIGRALKKEMRGKAPNIDIPSGSGETAVCYAMAYPDVRFKAVYDNRDPATSYSERSPLNALVAALCDVEIIKAD